jgi:tryptophanyl-tRNA synthetase
MARLKKLKPRILSGIQPTGELHIGNYLGAIVQFVKLQEEYDCYFMVADLHALTAHPNPKELAKQTLDVVRTYLAAGLNPQKATIFIQSHIHEHSELSWILSNFTSLGELERMAQFKEKSNERNLVSAGLFSYPILMAADILLYQAEKVPVGDDQTQHLELTREISRRFNNRFGKVFTEPKPLLTKQSRIMALNDPIKKMSKSLPGSYIALTDSKEMIRHRIRSAVTDTNPNPAVMSAGVANLFMLADHFVDRLAVAALRQKYHAGTLQYRELKESLADGLIKKLEPLQSKMKAFDDQFLYKIINIGAKQAELVAKQTLNKVQDAIGLINLTKGL